MQRTPFLTTIFACASALLLAAAAPAAELGDIAVRSYIGQPLAADIELVQLAPDEVSALQVRLAQQDVFRGANISMNPALASVHLSVVRRDGRQFLHITTTRNIDAEYVHLFLELSAAGRQDVRAATVWLQADPNPAPPPPPAMTAAQAAALARAERAAREAALASAPAPVAVPEAPAVAPVRDRTRPAPMPSAHESEVGEPGGLRTAPSRRPSAAVRNLPERIADAMGSTPRLAPRPAPALPSASNEAARGDGGVPLGVAQALLPLAPLPLPKGVKRPAAPAACTPSGMSAKECAALDTHSVELSSKLVELEGKVKLLQGALAAKGGAASAAPAALPSSASAGAHGGAASGGVAAGHAAAASAVHAASVQATAAAAVPAVAHGASASASASAASAAAASAVASGGSASASAAEEASAPVKKVRVLPKLKYKKEKPPEPAASNMPLIAAGAGVLALLLGAGGYFYLRKKRGAGPLKIWQGFRKKKPAGEGDPPVEAPPLHEVTPESMMQQ
ncbi:type IV pilus assembly protein FimV [Duganella sp. S19_KUP01_CR8]|uniref:type IV pilus assembly protein FimV n=1 Tax=Duganella sp. S19_KUP01_CR8 TaxID=3025502 RepID=UPI002FCD90B4